MASRRGSLAARFSGHCWGRVEEPRDVLEEVVHDLDGDRVDDGRYDRRVSSRHDARGSFVECSRQHHSHVDDTNIDPHQHYYECSDHKERDAGVPSSSASGIEGFWSPID